MLMRHIDKVHTLEQSVPSKDTTHVELAMLPLPNANKQTHSHLLLFMCHYVGVTLPLLQHGHMAESVKLGMMNCGSKRSRAY